MVAAFPVHPPVWYKMLLCNKQTNGFHGKGAHVPLQGEVFSSEDGTLRLARPNFDEFSCSVCHGWDLTPALVH